MNFTACGCVLLLRGPPVLQLLSPSATLPLSLLNTEICQELYCPWPLFWPQCCPLATSPLLSLPFETLNEEKINFTAPSNLESGTPLLSEERRPYRISVIFEPLK